MNPEPADAAARQAAVDPAGSCLVEAPAGSGKTQLLVARYLNLLRRVEHPEEILAITFTTKAASEMRSRVLAALSTDEEIRAINESHGWDLEERPDRLKIQTIDSFAFGLARRLPVAGAAHFEGVLENAWPLYEEAARRLLDRILDADVVVAEAVADFVALLDNDAERASGFIADALAKRDQWAEAVAPVARSPEQAAASVAHAVERLRQTVTGRLRNAVDQTLGAKLERVGAFVAEQLGGTWPGLGDPAGWQQLAQALLTNSGTPRKRFTSRDGFPPKDREAKGLAAETVRQLADIGLATALHRTRSLPDTVTADATATADTERALGAIAAVLALAMAELHATFSARGMMDFAESTVAANRALVDDDAPTDLALTLDYRIRHILVDEFQDTSLGQHQMLVALTRGWEPASGNTFFAVGDPMQSIYRFRNADLRLFLETALETARETALETADTGLEHVQIKRLRLTSNFRAGKALVDWCNAAFAGLFGAETDPVRGAVAFTPSQAEKEDTGQVRAVICEGEVAEQGRMEGETVADRVRELRRTGGSIAILVRTRMALRDILPVLRTAGIEWRGADVEALADEAVVRDLCSLATVLHDPADRLAWLALARSPMVGLDLADLERLAQTLASAARPPNCAPALSAQGLARWRRLAAALRKDQRSLTARGRVERVWLALGGSDAYQTEAALANADRFFGLLDARPQLARRPAELRRTIAGLYAADTDGAIGDAPAPVDVMTIHKAKGLEFDHVIVPGLAQPHPYRNKPLLLWRREGKDLLIAPRTHRGPRSLYDWLATEEADREGNETKRLFYVAATRATRSLTLVGALEIGQGPPKDSLAALIWPHVRASARWRRATGSAAATDDRPGRTSRRLPEGYIFEPAAALPPLAPRRAFGPSRPPGQDPVPGDRAQTTAGRVAVALGDLVHRELCWLAERSGGAANVDIARRAVVWRSWIAALPVSTAQAASILAELRRQVQGVLADSYGRWLLFHDPNGMCEAPFTASADGALTRVVVDRAFVDKGVRWVVDYKTGALPAGDEAAVAALTVRHAPQLARYAEVLRQLDGRPVRAALYLTALPRFVEVPVES